MRNFLLRFSFNLSFSLTLVKKYVLINRTLLPYFFFSSLLLRIFYR